MTRTALNDTPGGEHEHWTARHGKPIIFVILTLIAVGVYLATTIPVVVVVSGVGKDGFDVHTRDLERDHRVQIVG